MTKTSITKAAKPSKEKNSSRPQRARLVSVGDISPSYDSESLNQLQIDRRLDAASARHVGALKDILAAHTCLEDAHGITVALNAILEGASIDERQMLNNALSQINKSNTRTSASSDDVLSENWREGAYPYKNLMLRKSYERNKYQLQVELLKLQAWAKETGQKVVILFEGRDAAGKGVR